MTYKEKFLSVVKAESEKLYNKALSENCFELFSQKTVQNIIDGKTTFKNAYHNFKSKQRKADKANRKMVKNLTNINDINLFTKDIKELSESIEENSIDFIITDPPYPKGFLNVYDELSFLSSKVLKDGGLLIVMVGQSYLPEIINRLSKHMTYHWTGAYLTPGGQATQLWRRKAITFWKPLLIFRKGEYKGDWFGDVTKSDVNNNDKRFHEWGQSVSGMVDVLNRFTYPGDKILDPFCGAGTTGIACVLMNRKFVGSDIDLNCIRTSKKRIFELYDKK